MTENKRSKWICLITVLLLFCVAMFGLSTAQQTAYAAEGHNGHEGWEAYTGQTAAGNYYLTDNYENNINIGTTVTLCLNGYTVNRVTVKSSGDLTLADCKSGAVSGSVTVKGKLTLSGNCSVASVKLDPDCKIAFKEYTSTNPIELTVSSYGVFTEGWGGADFAGKFTCEESDTVVASEDELKIDLVVPDFEVENESGFYNERPFSLYADVINDVYDKLEYEWYKPVGEILGECLGTEDELAIEKVADSGTYLCKVTGTKDGTSKTAEVSGILVAIEKAPFDLSTVGFDDTFEYNAQSHSISVKSDTLPVGKDESTVSVSYENNARTDAGATDVTVKYTTDSENYYIKEEDASVLHTLTVSKMNIANYAEGAQIVLPSENLVYNGTELTQLVQSVTVNGIELTEGSYSLGDNTGICAGDYTLIVNGSGNFEGQLTKAFAIDKAEYDLEGIVFSSASVVYDGQVHYPTVSGLPTGADSVQLGSSFDKGATNVSEGAVTVTLSFVSNSQNYNTPKSTKQATITITPKDITVTIDSQSSYYGDELAQVTYKTVDAIEGDDLAVTIIRKEKAEDASATEKKDAGTYVLDGICNNSNYNATFVTATYTIEKCQVSLVIEDKSSIYGEALETLTYTATAVTDMGTIVDSDLGFKLILNDGSAVSDAKEYKISFTNDIPTNYSCNANIKTLSGKYTVLPRPVIVEWQTLTTEELVYSGSAKTVSATVTNLVGIDECTVETGIDVGDCVNVGTFTYKVKNVSNSNYTFPETNTSGEYTITAKPITVVLSEQTAVYGDEITLDNTKFDAGEISEELSITISRVQEEINVGTYDLQGTSANKNYDVTFDGSGKFTITKATVTVTAPSHEVEYGTAQPQYVCTYSGWKYGDSETCLTVEPTVDCAYTSTSAVGTPYETTASGAEATNYDFEYQTGSITVSQRVVTLTWNAPENLVYNKQAKEPTVTVGNLVGEDSCSATIAVTVPNSNINVGKFTFTASGLNNANYKLPTDVTSEEYTVIAKEVTLTWNAPSDLVYKKTAKEPTVVVGNLETDDACVATIALTAENNNIDVGSFTYTAISLDNDNYKLPTNVTSAVYEITAKVAELAWTAPENLVYNKTAKVPTVVVSNLESEDECAVIAGLSEGKDNINVGTFTFTASALSNENYKLPDEVTSSEYEITAKVATLAWTAPANLVYNKTEKEPTVVVSNLEIEDSCAVTAVLTVGNDNINVGSFTFTASALDNNNYKLPDNVTSSEYEITAKVATLAWTAPENLVYNKTEKVPTVVVSNLEIEDSCAVTAALTVGNDNINVGSFTFTASALDNENYKLPDEVTSSEYEITAKVATLAWTAPENLVYNKTAKVPTVVVSNLEIEDSCAVTAALTVGNDNINVGSFTFTASVLDNNNYKLPDEVTSSEYAIVAKAVIVTVANKTSVYGDGFEPLTSALKEGSSLAVGDTFDGLNIVLVKDEGLTVDKYAITGSYDNKNYAVTFENGEYTVTARAITLRIDGKSSTYGEAEVQLSAQLSEGSYADGDSYTELNVVLTKQAGVAAGVYDIDGVWNNGNYDVTFVGGQNAYTVTERPIRVTVDNKTSVYGEAFVDLTATVDATQLVSGDSLGYSLSKEEGAEVGTYIIGGVDTDSNYFVEFVTGTYTVTKKSVSVTVQDLLWTGAAQKAAVEDTEIYTVTSNEGGTDAGIYSVSVTLNDNKNYQWTTTDDDTLVISYTIRRISIELSDGNGEQIVSIANENGFNADLQATVTVGKEAKAAVLQKNEQIAAVYNVVLTNAADGQTYKITCEIPSEIEDKTFRLVDAETGLAIDYVKDGNTVVINTAKAGSYAFIYDAEVSLKTQITALAIVLALLLIVGVVFIVLLAKKKYGVTMKAILPAMFAVYYRPEEKTTVIILAVLSAVMLIADLVMLIVYVNKKKNKASKEKPLVEKTDGEIITQINVGGTQEITLTANTYFGGESKNIVAELIPESEDSETVAEEPAAEETPVAEEAEVIEEEPVAEEAEVIEEEPFDEKVEVIEEPVAEEAEVIEEEPFDEKVEVIKEEPFDEKVEVIEEEPFDEKVEVIEEEPFDEKVEVIEEEPVTEEAEQAKQETVASVAVSQAIPLDAEGETVSKRAIYTDMLRSFKAKLAQAGPEINEYYDRIKNKLLSYRTAKSRVSWFYDRFKADKKEIAKITVRGKTLCLYLALDPDNLDLTKYKTVEAVKENRFADVPCMIKIKCELHCNRAMELIEKLAGKMRLKPMSREKVNYCMPYMTSDELVQKGMIKPLGKSGNTKEEVAAQSAELRKKQAQIKKQSAEQAKKASRKNKSFVNLEDIEKLFENGEVVSMEELAKRDPKKFGNIESYKVLAHGTISKALTVEANDFSAEAIKVIESAGGKVIKK